MITMVKTPENFLIDQAPDLLAELLENLKIDPRKPKAKELREVAGWLSEIIGRSKPWTDKYLLQVLHRSEKVKASADLVKAIERLGAVKVDGVPAEFAGAKPVTILAEDGAVLPGSFTKLKSKRCANPRCHVSFIGYPNQKYHDARCRAEHQKLLKKERNP